MYCVNISTFENKTPISSIVKNPIFLGKERERERERERVSVCVREGGRMGGRELNSIPEREYMTCYDGGQVQLKIENTIKLNSFREHTHTHTHTHTHAPHSLARWRAAPGRNSAWFSLSTHSSLLSSLHPLSLYLRRERESHHWQAYPAQRPLGVGGFPEQKMSDLKQLKLKIFASLRKRRERERERRG